MFKNLFKKKQEKIPEKKMDLPIVNEEAIKAFDAIDFSDSEHLDEQVVNYLNKTGAKCPWGDWGDFDKFSEWMESDTPKPMVFE